MLIKTLISLALGIYILMILLLYAFQKAIIFYPIPLPENYDFHFGAPFEELSFPTGDGEKVSAVYFKTGQTPKGVVFYFHGNTANLQRWGRFHRDFTARGYDFLAMDYRGFGKSTGEINERGIYRDARMIYDWLAQKYDANEIILWGRSLGTGVASRLATEVPCEKLVLETPFNSIKGLIKTKAPYLWLPFPPKFRFPNSTYLPKINCPVYIIQGTEDRVVPYESAAKLKRFLKPEDRFFTIRGAGHRDFTYFSEYNRITDEILSK